MSRSGPEAEHPARFPIGLPKEIIAAFSNESALVCDPFLGSGTIGVAAIQLGRKFAGMEIEPKYFDIACRRISEAVRQQDLFIEKPKPVQENLDFCATAQKSGELANSIKAASLPGDDTAHKMSVVGVAVILRSQGCGYRAPTRTTCKNDPLALRIGYRRGIERR